MPWVGFEPTIPALERAKTVHALDGAATVIGHHEILYFRILRKTVEPFMFNLRVVQTCLTTTLHEGIQLSMRASKYLSERKVFCTKVTLLFGAITMIMWQHIIKTVSAISEEILFCDSVPTGSPLFESCYFKMFWPTRRNFGPLPLYKIEI
jgi:hypothetical protein